MIGFATFLATTIDEWLDVSAMKTLFAIAMSSDAFRGALIYYYTSLRRF